MLEVKSESELFINLEELYPGNNKGVEPGARGVFSRNAPAKDATWYHNVSREGVLQLVLINLEIQGGIEVHLIAEACLLQSIDGYCHEYLYNETIKQNN